MMDSRSASANFFPSKQNDNNKNTIKKHNYKKGIHRECECILQNYLFCTEQKEKDDEQMMDKWQIIGKNYF
jgi:hypothetical protein